MIRHIDPIASETTVLLPGSNFQVLPPWAKHSQNCKFIDVLFYFRPPMFSYYADLGY